MNENIAKLVILEQTALARILVFLKYKKVACRSELINGVRVSQQAVYNAVPKLLAQNLIKPVHPKGSPRRKDVVLTEKGIKLADALEQLLEILV